MLTEAHIPADRRPTAFVRYLRRPRRSLWRWIAFLAFIALNETRGVYVVVHVFKAWVS